VDTYIVDGLACTEEIMGELKPIFESLEIIKYFHDFKNDVIRLLVDYGINTKCIIDTQYLYRKYTPNNSQMGPGDKISLTNMILQLFKTTQPDECRQLESENQAMTFFPWIHRPLPPEAIMYVKGDVYRPAKAVNVMKLVVSVTFS